MNIKCYLTGLDITETNKSAEHIVPNALGGRLKSSKILCSRANVDLSKTIDTPFNKMFEGTYKRLLLRKDRMDKTGLSGIHADYNKRIIFKDNRCFPVKPFYDKEKTVYSKTQQIGEDYVKHLKEKNKIPKELKIDVKIDMAGILEFPFILDNQILRKGFAKIAAGFATHHRVDRSHMQRVLDLERKTFRDDILLIPYYPVQNDAVFELRAHHGEHYPMHSISLKGDRKNKILYCYVELFSTFQYIVILNDIYEGDNFHYEYLYDLKNSKEISSQEYWESTNSNATQINKVTHKYKNLNISELEEISHIITNQYEKIQHYTFCKFLHLETFTNSLTLFQKLEKLDIEKDNFDCPS